MKNLLIKEVKLSASPLSFFFILFSLMTMIPGYPILVGAFFVCFGLFHTFQNGRENEDTLYTALLPIRKRDVVLARFIFILGIESVSFLISLILTLVRMSFLSEVIPYKNNAMMNANLVYLGFILLIYGVFNYFYTVGFYKTAYAIGKPFLCFGIISFLIIGVAETLHHLPKCQILNATGYNAIGLQIIIFIVCAFVFLLLTIMGKNKSQRLFESIDL